MEVKHGPALKWALALVAVFALGGCAPGPSLQEAAAIIENDVIQTPEPLGAVCAVNRFNCQKIMNFWTGDDWGVSYNFNEVGNRIQKAVADTLVRSNFFSGVVMGSQDADVILDGFVEKMLITGNPGCTTDGIVYYKVRFPKKTGIPDLTDSVRQKDFCPGNPDTYGQALDLLILKIAQKIVDDFVTSDEMSTLREKMGPGGQQP